MDDLGGVPLRTRIFVLAFLAAFVVAGAARIEAWPLTGWRLFSQPRSAYQVSWEAVAVDGEGLETPLPFERLSGAYRGFLHVLKGFRRLPETGRVAACDAWASAFRRLGGRLEALRVYRIERDVSARAGRRGAPPAARVLAYTCADGAVRAEAGFA